MASMSGISRCLPGRGGLYQVIIFKKILDILCVPQFSCTTLAKNWGRGLPRAGKEGVTVCNMAALTDFGLVWILDFLETIIWMYCLDRKNFNLERFWIGFEEFGLYFICEIINWICITNKLILLFESRAPY